MRLSATLVKTYRTCPRQYRYRYVERLPTVLTAPLAFGRAIHDTLCELHGRLVEYGLCLDLTEALDAFDRRWSEVLKAERALLQDPEAEARQYGELAADILLRYVEQYRDRPPPLAVEFPFEITWQNHTIIGYVDRIDEVEAGLEIVEFKTGKRKPSRKEIDEDLQLILYAKGVREALGCPVTRVVYVHLRDGAELPTEPGEDAFRSLCEGVLAPVASGIEAGRHPPKHGWWCRWCDYQSLCEREEPEELFGPPALAHVGIP